MIKNISSDPEKIKIFIFSLIAIITLLNSCTTQKTIANNTTPAFPKNYHCIPFANTANKGAPQIIPGRLQNENYDTMNISNAQKAAGAEENFCYHDNDNINNGSGTFNGTGTYNKEFRMHESVDISYIKFNNHDVAVDDSSYNLVTPDSDSLYIGWIAPGEWINYTVNVQEAGYYSLTTMYTSKFGGHISFDCNGKDITGPLELTSTYIAADPVDWRQAHHWNKAVHLGKFYLPAGKQLLTLHILDQPVFNFDYMDFIKIE